MLSKNTFASADCAMQQISLVFTYACVISVIIRFSAILNFFFTSALEIYYFTLRKTTRKRSKAKCEKE